MMLVRIDFEKKTIVEQGEDYVVLDIPRANGNGWIGKIRTATVNLFCDAKMIRTAKGLWLGSKGGVTLM